MSFFSQRVIWLSNGSVVDLSSPLNDFLVGSETFAFKNATDYLVIGSDLPFNHKYFDVGTANDVSASLSVDIWYAGAWTPAVDIIDETKTSGVSLAKSGMIQFRPEHDKGWDREQYSDDVTGLSDTDYYNMYWARFKWSADLKNTTALSFIGEKFSTDEQLFAEYPMLNNTSLMSKWKTGKTNWNDQHYAAARYIVTDLKARRVITSEHQIIDSSLFVNASVHKTAKIIFAGLGGDDMAKNAEIASNRYDKAMKMDNFFVDMDADGDISDYERSVTFGELVR